MLDTVTPGRSVAELIKGIKVIDVDTHLSEPHDMWTSRAPAKWKDRVPQVIDDGNGNKRWMIDGNRYMGVSSACSVVHRDGRQAEGVDFTSWQIDDVHPACSQTKARIALMDEIGVHAQIVYANVMGFAGQGRGEANSKALPPMDEDLRLISTQIFNDAMGEMQAESGDRLLPMAMMPWWDIKLAMVEAERCFAMGMRGININSDPHIHGMQDLSGEYWYPLWELCQDRGIPVNFHIGASDASMSWYGDTPWPSQSPAHKLSIGGTMMFISNARVVCNIIASGMLDRFPSLKFVSVESGIGWLPFILEALQYQMDTSSSHRYELTALEYFRRQMYGCFWFENQDSADAIRKLGVDNVLFETDFPHPTCLFPDPFGKVADGIAQLTEAERRKVMSTNAAALYNIAI
jgi:predicted TIM-barrel fold metal-dependent hydrolase